jgi:hypothetical protein
VGQCGVKSSDGTAYVCRLHRPTVAGDLAGKPTQSIHIGWCLDDLDGGAVLVQQTHVQTVP